MEENKIFNLWSENKFSAEDARKIYFESQREMLTVIYDLVRSASQKGDRFVHLDENFKLGSEAIELLKSLQYVVEEIYRDNSVERANIQTISIYW